MNKNFSPVLAWHWLFPEKTLGYGDGRKVRLRRPLKVGGKPVLGQNGLHGCRKLLNTFSYRESEQVILCRVEIGGEIDRNEDKLCGTERTVVAWKHGKEFARACLGVLHERCERVAKKKKIEIPEFFHLARRYLEDLKSFSENERINLCSNSRDLYYESGYNSQENFIGFLCYSIFSLTEGGCIVDALNDLVSRAQNLYRRSSDLNKILEAEAKKSLGCD